MTEPKAKGPLSGIRVVEMEGIGPAPLAAMLMADLGAEIIRIERVSASGLGIARPRAFDFALRGRSAIRVNLKRPEGVKLVLDLIAGSDALIEGFRPGVMERLGLGPEPSLVVNPRLVYGRLTGWGQDGPLAKTAGHDLNYLALSGVLDRLGRAGSAPTPPMNLLGDYAGGSLLMAFGLLAGILSARVSGQGQVVDAAIVDGVSLLALPLMGLIGAGIHDGERGKNLLDTGAPHYDVYPCSDGLYLSVAAIEEKFRVQLLEGLGLDPLTFPDLNDKTTWADAKRLIGERISSRPRAHWIGVFEGGDACVTPVLSFKEAMEHPHNLTRAMHIDIDGKVQPAPAPRFSKTPAKHPEAATDKARSEAHTLADWGIDAERLKALRASGAIL